ncbi:MAG: OmpA family protein [Ignavibacteriae bacterium]|nr:OmpA family protein [Ignavibacteriota bacterium]
MSRSQNDVPIIIKKKKGGGHGHHGGAWKVAYADFVTAMMALFIVLWIVGQSKQVKQYVANYFKDPGAFFENTKGGGMFSGTSVTQTQQSVVEENLQRESKRLKQLASTILKQAEKDSSLQGLMGQMQMELTEEGMRIQLYESAQNVYFDVGTSHLKPEATRLIATIAHEVGKLTNKVVIEGHTDSRPYSKQDGYTNFELSADRANAARRVMSTNGMRIDQIAEVRGYADTRLRDRNRPFDETNRRISILIKFEDKSHEQSAEDTPR